MSQPLLRVLASLQICYHLDLLTQKAKPANVKCAFVISVDDFTVCLYRC